MTRRITVAVALLFVFAAAACSDDKPRFVDTDAAEREILDYLVDTYPAATFESVTCPAEVVIDEGDTFTCLAAMPDDELHVEVTQEDDEGSAISYVATEAIVIAAEAKAEVEGQVLPEFTGGVTVDCGLDAVLVLEPGSTFECTATGALGEVHTVKVTVEDISGNLTIELV